MVRLLVPEDDQVLRLTSRGDDVDFPVAVEVGDFYVLDGHLLAGDLLFTPLGTTLVRGTEEFDAGFASAALAAPADDDVVFAVASHIGNLQGVAGDEFVVEDLDVFPEASFAFHVNGGSDAVMRFDGDDEAFAVREATITDFAGGLVRKLFLVPLAFALVEVPDAFLAAKEKFLFGILIPVHVVKVVGEMHEVADDRAPDIAGLRALGVVFPHETAFADATLVASAVKRFHDEGVFAAGGLDPVHAMDGGFVFVVDRCPRLRSILAGDEAHHGATGFFIGGVAGVPLATDGDFAFAVAVGVAGGDADVVTFGEVLGDDVFFPGRGLIPLDRLLVGEHDVVFAVAVHVGDLDAVTDLDVVDFLGREFGSLQTSGCQYREGKKKRAVHGMAGYCEAPAPDSNEFVGVDSRTSVGIIRFTMRCPNILPVVAFCLLCFELRAADILVADFEGTTYGDWKVEGEAFGPGPARGTLPRQMRVFGFKGKGLVNSFFKGDNSVGKLTSPPFKLQKHYLNFLIGGGGHDGLSFDLIVGGEVVRSARGGNTRSGGSEKLEPASWDVKEFQRRDAILQVIDQRRGGWGHINVDHVVQSDHKIEAEPAQMNFTATENYLHVPVRTGATKRRLKLLLDGKSVREMDVELAVDAKASFLVAIDIRKWNGKQLTLDAGKLVGRKEALKGIAQARALPNRDGIYQEAKRPLFHFTSKIGWLNDPNGLVYHQGEWHLFYQHNPYGWNWGNMHWGHAVSRDLFHWRELGDAIFPWSDCKAMAFSGCAVIDHRNTSGFGGPGDPPLIVSLTDTGLGESIGYSRDNGRTIKLYEGNPVVKHKGRDPKIIWHEGTRRWVMALYDEFEKRRWMAFYSSKDLKQWKFHSRLENYYECPDLFELPIDGDRSNTRWVVYGADGKYTLGSFDGRKFTPDHEGKHQVWFGNFYAAQTYDNAPNGRRVQIGWGRGITFPGMPFNQQMTVPVELTLRTTSQGLRMFAEPVKELEKLRGAKDLADQADR